ncbi:MAG: formimidoylglutamase [Phycisphaeraceae bacterium]|nr:formimidoylglutamase [Phycisphaeraceae bacterium]
MGRDIPHTMAPVWPAISADRLAQTILNGDGAEGDVALIGLPDETGVRLNHGRPGAAQGPAAFRAALARYGTTFDAAHRTPLTVRIVDAGDVEPAPGDDAAALQETHDRITQALSAIHDRGMIPVCIGGGHDLTFPSVRALAQRVGGPVGGVNLDAHLDVRETVGSGMPFRRLIEGGFLDASRHVTLGVGRFANSREHVEWLTQRGGILVTADEALTRPDAVSFSLGAAMRLGAGFVSIDLDGIDSSQAPGVSSPNPLGLTAMHANQLASLAGRHPAVRHLDLMELSPPNDVDGRTARLAAQLFLSFTAGVQERGA